MIVYLNGVLAEKSPDNVVVECCGVGYEALIPLSTFDRLPATGENVKLFTYHAVREDDEILFGFFTRDERDMFVKVTAVSGVGPKTALAVLSGFTTGDLHHCGTRKVNGISRAEFTAKRNSIVWSHG